MRKIIYAFFMLLLASGRLNAQEWQELKGEHFLVYFLEDKGFARNVLHKAEKDYKRIASDLGYARSSNFWTWADRVKIYIYPGHASYLQASAQPAWSEGMADYTNKRIVSYSGSEDFLNSLLPHEIAHLIFRDFVGFKSEIPLWIDEGVAQWAEQAKRERVRAMVSQFAREKSLISLKDMMRLDIRLVKENDTLHLLAISIDDKAGFVIVDGNSLIDLYYLQAVSLVSFLIERYGGNNFANFCRQLRDGKDVEASLRSAYSTYLSGLDDLEYKWIKYLQEE